VTPAAPTALPGYTSQRLLEPGRFPDVSPYQQHLPRLLVAVKVLLSDLATESAQPGAPSSGG
jgi:hypothetical protein